MSDDLYIELDEEAARQAIACGKARWALVVANNRHRPDGKAGQGTECDTILGQLGEAAAATGVLRLPYVAYVGLPGKERADQYGYEIKTRSFERGELLTYEDEPDDRPIICMAAFDDGGPYEGFRLFKAAGWMISRECKRPYYAHPSPKWRHSYRLTQHELHPIQTLLETTELRAARLKQSLVDGWLRQLQQVDAEPTEI